MKLQSQERIRQARSGCQDAASLIYELDDELTMVRRIALFYMEILLKGTKHSDMEGLNCPHCLLVKDLKLVKGWD